MTFWFVWITLGNSKTKNPVWTGCLGGATKKHRREAGNGWDRKGQEAVRGAPASELVCGATGAPHTWKTLGEHILRSYPHLRVSVRLLRAAPRNAWPPACPDRAGSGLSLHTRASRAARSMWGHLHRGEKGCLDVNWMCFTYFRFLVSWTPSTLTRECTPKGQRLRAWESILCGTYSIYICWLNKWRMREPSQSISLSFKLSSSIH